VVALVAIPVAAIEVREAMVGATTLGRMTLSMLTPAELHFP